VSRFALGLWFVAAVLAARAGAALLPSEIAIVAARGNAPSEELARYYAKARNIPEGQICLVDVPTGDECPRDTWSSAVRPAIRQWLAEHDPDRKLRCLVTVWGMPLKIAAAEPAPAMLKYQAFLAGERGVRMESLHKTLKDFEAIAPAGQLSTDVIGQSGGGAAATNASAAVATAPAPPAGSPGELQWIQTHLDAAVKSTQARISVLPVGPVQQVAQARFQELIARTGGAVVILQSLKEQLDAPLDRGPAVVAEYHRVRGAGAAWIEAQEIFAQLPPSFERDAAILRLVERIGGAIAAVAWLDEQIAVAKKNETAAALDSELALVLWDEGYDLLRWAPNYLHRNYDGSYLRAAFPTMMVSRLDAPTPELARGIIDAALQAERAGLAGKAYFDSRGLAKSVTGPTGVAQAKAAEFDRMLLVAAAVVKEKTTLEVVVNDQPALFGPGECPDVALYWGWYSLGKYVDAFTFNHGAIAFHIAGDEADGLHDPDSQRWCKRLLEDGAAATIGGVFEPYLYAYPTPNEFFGLLLNGDDSLAECFWRTQPFASWSLMLIGDPLYQPFKNRDVERPQTVIRGAGK
jgi:uncharacterized protein (TIGR03790 family)